LSCVDQLRRLPQKEQNPVLMGKAGPGRAPYLCL
jgi:hypothetical protein